MTWHENNGGLTAACKRAFVERGGPARMGIEDWAGHFDFAKLGRPASLANDDVLGEEGFYSLGRPISILPEQGLYGGDVIINQAKASVEGSMTAAVEADGSLLVPMLEKASARAAAWLPDATGDELGELEALAREKPRVLIACADLVDPMGEGMGERLRLWAGHDLSRRPGASKCYGNSWPERLANAALQVHRVPYTEYAPAPIHLEGPEAKYGFMDACEVGEDLLMSSGLFDDCFDYIGWADEHGVLEGLVQRPDLEPHAPYSLHKQSARAARRETPARDAPAPSKDVGIDI